MKLIRKNKKNFVSAVYYSEKLKVYLLLFFVLLVCSISFLKPSLTTDIKISTIDIISPLLSFINRPFEEASQKINSISNISALKAENARLKLENERLKEWYQTALMLDAENKSLHSLLNLNLSSEVKYVSARVLSDTQNTFSKTLLISAGESNNIKLNQVVLSGEGILGRIIEVGDKVSRILLITDINSRIPVKIEKINKKAIVTGDNSDFLSVMYMDYLDNDLIGKKVITTGDGGVFPAGLVVGTIAKIDNNIVYVKPLSQMDNIEFVKIIEKEDYENAVVQGNYN